MKGPPKRRKSARAKTAAPRARKPVKSASGFSDPHVVKGLQYAEAVVSGRIAACKWVRLACRRQLRDLERWRSGEDAWPFRFEEAKGGRAARFFEQLPHTQGPLSFRRPDGRWNTLALEPWQCFVTTTVYGWIRKDSPPERPVRRFSRVYEEEPRGQGKSFRLSGGMLYSFTEGEQGVEAYSAAVDRAQAAKVYGEAEAMLEKRPDLKQALELETSAVAIFQKSSHSRAAALSREAKKSGDGMNIYFAAVDELHAHPTREVWDVLDTGTGKRGGNALIWIITTAGFNTAGVCFEKREYVKKVLEGVVQDDTWFAIIYTIDEEDDWKDEACRAAGPGHTHPGCVWRKANPNWGISVDPVDFESKMSRAMQVASEQNGILTKHLNVWCNADVSWMDMAAWDRCADSGLKEEAFAGEACVLGLDLASKVDIAVRAKLFYRDLPAPPKEDKEQPPVRHYYHFLGSYLPEGAVRSSSNAQYSGWVREGRIRTTPGDVLDYEAVKEDVVRDQGKHDLREVAFDPWQATQMSNELQAKAVVMVEVRPTVQNFSEPMKQWEALVLEGRFHHDGNPVMRWMVSNVVCHRDEKDNIYPRKAIPDNKIDGAVATIMALNRAILAPVETGSIYERRGIRTL